MTSPPGGGGEVPPTVAPVGELLGDGAPLLVALDDGLGDGDELADGEGVGDGVGLTVELAFGDGVAAGVLARQVASRLTCDDVPLVGVVKEELPLEFGPPPPEFPCVPLPPDPLPFTVW